MDELLKHALIPGYTIYKVGKGMTKDAKDMDSVINRIVKGIQAIPLIGGFVPNYTADGKLSDSQIRDILNKAYSKLNELDNKDRSKLNQLTNLISEYSNMIGSPSLNDFIRTRKTEAQETANKIENTIANRDVERQNISSRAEDLINKDQPLRGNDTEEKQSFDKAVEKYIKE